MHTSTIAIQRACISFAFVIHICNYDIAQNKCINATNLNLVKT